MNDDAARKKLEDIIRKIEELRSELHKLIENRTNLGAKEVLKLSLELDRVLTEYYKLKQGK